jgi:hypothetical protein
MSEEGPISEGPAMASATDHEYSSHSQQPIHVAPNRPIQHTSRKSTLNKSDFDVHVGTGTQTPMSHMHRGSRHMLELDDYFVCYAHISWFQSPTGNAFGAETDLKLQGRTT